MPPKVSKSELKPNLFRYLRKISETGQELIITEHGKPVLKIVPLSAAEQNPLEALRGTIESYENPLEPIDILWEAAEPRKSKK